MKWFQKFIESVDQHAGKNVGKIVAKSWEELPSGSSKRAKQERTRWIKSAMEQLDTLCDEKTRNQIMIDTCPHSYPKTRIKEMRAEFKRLGNLDSLLKLMWEDKSWGGGSFYDYPVRKSDDIHITKVPFNPKAYKNAVTEEEKRLAYCHCSLVRSSKENISSTFCCCSGGWVKQLWEGIFEQPVEVQLTESLLKGDDQCTHSVHIPIEFR
ncbi:MAG: hypothetical protein ACFFCX_17350 [Candidatus Sifarchaeia archaeon]